MVSSLICLLEGWVVIPSEKLSDVKKLNPKKHILGDTYIATYDMFVVIFPIEPAYVAAYVTSRMVNR